MGDVALSQSEMFLAKEYAFHGLRFQKNEYWTLHNDSYKFLPEIFPTQCIKGTKLHARIQRMLWSRIANETSGVMFFEAHIYWYMYPTHIANANSETGTVENDRAAPRFPLAKYLTGPIILPAFLAIAEVNIVPSNLARFLERTPKRASFADWENNGFYKGTLQVVPA